jgi:hypothetical protein
MSTTSSTSGSSEHTFRTANASLPLSPPASPQIAPLGGTSKIDPASDDELISSPELNHEEPLEVGEETVFGSTTQSLGESNETKMRAPDTRIFRQPEYLRDIDYLVQKMNMEWCGPRGYAVLIRTRSFADQEKTEPNKVKFYCTRGRRYQADLSNWDTKDYIKQDTLKRTHATIQRCDCPFSGYFRQFAKTPDQWNLIITNGMHNHDLEDDNRLPNLRTLRSLMTDMVLNPGFDDYAIGRCLGQMARSFGARAPVNEIASQILTDCPRCISVDYQNQWVKWEEFADPIDFDHFYWITRGINDSLFECWLADSTFYLDYLAYVEWTKHLREEMQILWDHYWEDISHEVWSGANSNLEDENARKLQRREQSMNALVEKKAIAIGL